MMKMNVRSPRVLTALAALLLVGSAVHLAGQGPVAETAASIPRILMPEFKKLVEQNAVLVIDVRDPQSYQMGHIPGAVLIQTGSLEAKAAELKSEKRPIVTYCL
jgi:predicted sulfurtransferase